MFQVNEYFNGTVKSLGFNNNGGKFTVGVMAKGDYEFSTSSREYMTLVSGSWDIKLPGQSDFKKYEIGSTFIVEKGSTFLLKVNEESAYLCKYE